MGQWSAGALTRARTYPAAFYEIPCNATATVALAFGGQAYAFDRADLVLGKTASDTTCVLRSSSSPSLDRFWSRLSLPLSLGRVRVLTWYGQDVH